MSLKLKVGSRLRDLRNERGLTQEALAELIDRSVDGVSAMERGLTLPSFETLERLGSALHVPVSRLFEDPGEAAESTERSRLEARLSFTASKLDDDGLRLALDLVEVVAKRTAGK